LIGGLRFTRQTLDYYANPANRRPTWKHLTTEEILAVIHYGLGPIAGHPRRGCYVINQALRTRDVRELDRLESDIKVLASALTKLGGELKTTYRYADIKADALAHYQPGAIVTERAFTSTSLTKDEAGTHTVIWVIHGRGGGRYIYPITDREKEVLYPPGSLFEVKSRRTVIERNPDLGRPPRYELIEMVEVPAAAQRFERSTDVATARTSGDVYAAPPSKNPRGAAILAAWKREPFDAEAFVDALGTLAPLKDRWPRPARVAEGYSCRRHHAMVVGQYAKYFGRPPYLLALTLGMHDAGKPDDDINHHQATKPIFLEAFRTLGIQESVAERWYTFASADPLGAYIRGWTGLRETVATLNRMAEKAGMDRAQFLETITRFYQADAGSYTRDAGGEESLDRLFAQTATGGFILDPARGRLRFNRELEPKFRALEESFRGDVSSRRAL
jgi:hypothetical protein